MLELGAESVDEPYVVDSNDVDIGGWTRAKVRIPQCSRRGVAHEWMYVELMYATPEEG
jgi:hypothetical protein